MSRLFQRFGNRKIITPQGSATMEFDLGLQKAFKQLETQISDLTQIVLNIQAADTKARARMDDLPDVAFDADYTGTLSADQLPRDIEIERYDGSTSVSSTSTWTVSVESGSVSCSIGAATGVLTITAISSNAVLLIESTRDGLTLRKKQVLRINYSAPPNTGGTGGTTAWTDTTFNSVSSNVMAAISDELTVTVGSSGTVSLSAPLDVSTSAISPAEVINVYSIWQWWDGAAWTDLGTEVGSSDCTVTESIRNPGTYNVSEGFLTVPSSKSGLVAAATEKFRLMARRASGFHTMSFNGTASAVS